MFITLNMLESIPHTLSCCCETKSRLQSVMNNMSILTALVCDKGSQYINTASRGDLYVTVSAARVIMSVGACFSCTHTDVSVLAVDLTHEFKCTHLFFLTLTWVNHRESDFLNLKCHFFHLKFTFGTLWTSAVAEVYWQTLWIIQPSSLHHQPLKYSHIDKYI